METADRPTFRLTVLGRFQLHRGEQAIDLPSRKLACLLTYLACTAPIPQPREKLATLLWGSGSDEQARHNLRQAVSKLRQMLGQKVIVNKGDAIALASGMIECDAARLDCLTDESSPAAIAAAAELYGGPLLEDIFVNEAGWTDWIIRERERLSERAIGAMVQHAEAELESCKIANALRLGQRAVTLNAFREDAHRLIFKALAAAGRNSEALRNYNSLVSYLKSELMAEPDHETQLLIAELGRKRLSPKPAVLNEAAIAVPAPSDLSLRAKPSGNDQIAATLSYGRPDTVVDATRGLTATTLERAHPQLLTVLVARMAVSGPLALSSRGEDTSDLDASFRKTVAVEVAKFGGFLTTVHGPAVHVYFGYPIALTNDALQAVKAAKAIIAAVPHLSPAGSWSALQASIGIATGLAVIGKNFGPDDDGDPIASGDCPSLAIELQALASPGEIVVSHDLQLQLKEIFAFRALDSLDLHGGPQPQKAWQFRGDREEDHSALDWIKEVAMPTRYEDGSYVFRLGDPPDHLYFLQSGTVLFEEIGLRMHAGELFGEIAFFTRQPERTASARCEGICEIISQSEADLTEKFMRDPVFSLNVVRALAKRLVESPVAADKRSIPFLRPL